MKRNYEARYLRMKDQAPRQRFLDEHDAHWNADTEEDRIVKGKIALICFVAMFVLSLLAVYAPVEASTVWQSVSDQSLVDAWGEE